MELNQETLKLIWKFNHINLELNFKQRPKENQDLQIQRVTCCNKTYLNVFSLKLENVI